MLNRKGSDADALARVGFASGFAVPAEALGVNCGVPGPLEGMKITHKVAIWPTYGLFFKTSTTFGRNHNLARAQGYGLFDMDDRGGPRHVVRFSLASECTGTSHLRSRL